MRYAEIMTEAEIVLPYEWVTSPNADFAAIFHAADVPYAVYFDGGTTHPTVFSVSFSAMADPQTRWQRDVQPADHTPEAFQKRKIVVPQYAIYATVGRVIEDFLHQHHPLIIRFTGATPRQTEIYGKLLKRLSLSGYHLENIGRHSLVVRDGSEVPDDLRRLV